MASYFPPKKNAVYITYVSLNSQANSAVFQDNPTLAAGDVKVVIDDGASANITTLPEVDADFTKRVKLSLSADEMNGDNITVVFYDASGAEWCDLTINIQTTTQQIDDLSTHSAADVWAAATRTLTAISDSAGVTTLLSRIGAALNISGGKVESNVKQINGTNVTGDGSATPWGPE